MKITDLRCIQIPDLQTLILRIDTDEGVYGLSQVEKSKFAYATTSVLFFRDFIVGLDPRNVEDVMRRIRRVGAFKPWGAAVSSIEIALWDIAGKAAGSPVHRMLGGKIRDRVRPYMGSTPPFTEPLPHVGGDRPEDFHAAALARKNAGAGMSIMKTPIGFHDGLWKTNQANHLGIAYQSPPRKALFAFTPTTYAQVSGIATPRGMRVAVECVAAIRDAVGDDFAMALDCGPGWKLPSAAEFAREVEQYKPLWLEDLVTGDYTPYVDPDVYRELKNRVSANIHTGEQIYLRQNYKALIESGAVDVVGPDPMDVGGLAELKWIAEYADLHGVLMAPHGIGDGPFGLAALIQLCATLPDNLIAFELPIVEPAWSGLITGLAPGMVVDGLIDVPDLPGLGVDLVEDAVRERLGTDNIYVTA